MRTLVEKTLAEFGYYSPDSANLILGTIAQESAYGKYRKQLGDGPALGICQIEPGTFNDIVTNYLRYRPEITEKIKRVAQVDELKASDAQFKVFYDKDNNMRVLYKSSVAGKFGLY